MSNSYTHYWKNSTCDKLLSEWSTRPLVHAADNHFDSRSRRVAAGDRIYAVTVRKGLIYLIGRLTVGRIARSDEAAENILGYPPPWSASVHVIAEPGTGTPICFDRQVPIPVARQLSFDSATKSLKFVDEAAGLIDRQTLTSIRPLSGASADLLDKLLRQTP